MHKRHYVHPGQHPFDLQVNELRVASAFIFSKRPSRIPDSAEWRKWPSR